ncbi:MAG: EamA family transporter [Candidatus Methanoperedens sp.]|nr:EamA family transporter [Candidatus Methanoperedens sp.]MCZ7371368.1 EamA family transporter [Candidatus Methanoperedens sp.]
MNWFIYAVACLFLYGIMQFFIKLASTGGNPVASSMIFIVAQFLSQILLGAYLMSKSEAGIDYGSIKFGVAGGIVAGIATIFFFLALQQSTLSKVVPIVNMNVVVAVLLGVILLKDAVNYRMAAGIVLAVMSIYLLTN